MILNKKLLFIVKNLYTMERLGVMQISAVAKLQGWQTRLLVTDGKSYGSIQDHVDAYDPDILAFSAMSPEYPYLEQLAGRLYQANPRFTLFGGSHPTFFQEIIHRPFIQAISFGEADLSFPRFLEAFANGEDYTGTHGMHFQSDGDVIFNEPERLVEDLDALPFPDRFLQVGNKTLADFSRSHIFMASRGCPNQCTYCFNHKFNQMFRQYGPLYRHRTVGSLVSEMQKVRDSCGMKFAYIDDDIFTLCSREWLDEFAGLYPARVGVPFMVNIHVNAVTREQLQLLSRAGCALICFGIECGVEEISRTILKRNIGNEKIERLSRWIHELGMKFMTQNILALPVPNPLDVDLQTLRLNIRCRPDYAIAHIYFPLPGTELTEYCVENGYLEPGSGKLPERTNSFSALRFPSKKEKAMVQRLHKLFGLAVNFPVLIKALPMLVRLPAGWIYSFVFVAWYGFSMRYRLERTRKSWKETAYFLRNVLQSATSFFRRRDAVR
jgi:anaerobic magnesium-protoporphyrin IX monomethyl ester cyclase